LHAQNPTVERGRVCADEPAFPDAVANDINPAIKDGSAVEDGVRFSDTANE